MQITERRLVCQEWYETEYSKTGWDSHGWMFKDDHQGLISGWDIVEHIKTDKYGNAWLGIAEKETEIR
jgi:hypothetical protein